MANSPPKNPDGSMPFFEHLEELRRRLFYAAIALLIGGLVAWGVFELVPMWVPGWDPIAFLQQPIHPYLHGHQLVYTRPGEAFQIMLNVGFWIAFVFASPVIIYQLWAFVSPAMYQHEKKVAIPVILAIVVLFVIGVIIAYLIILPLTLKFLIGVGSESITPMISVTEYFGFATYMCLGFGLAFELPIVIMGLTAIGLAKPDFLAKYRRYAFVGCLIGATFITPDPTSMFVIAIPIYLLFELSIVLSRMVVRAKVRRKAEEEGEVPADATVGVRSTQEAVAESVPREPRRLSDLD